jgi:hypothetical protein
VNDYTPDPEWIPTTEHIRYRYWSYGDAVPDSLAPVAERVTGRDFDRWLAAHDRQVKADAWDEGFKQGGPMHDADMNDPDAHKRNPYRTEESTP